MNDLSGGGSGEHACPSCTQTHFGAVRHCPFCGVRQSDATSSTVAPALAQPDGDAKPLTRWGSQVEEVVQPAVAVETPISSASPHVPPQPPTPKPQPVRQPKSPVVQAASVESPVAAAVPAKRSSSGMFKWVGPLVVAVAGYFGWQFFTTPKPPDVCQLALEGAASAMQTGQFAQAKAQALGAVARCTGESQDRAKTVLKAADAAHAADENCGKAVRQADGQIADGRLKLAQRTLDSQPGACLARQDATASKQRMESNRTSAAEKLGQGQTQLSDGQIEQARASLNEAEKLDHDNADLSKTRREIEVKAKAADGAILTRASPFPVPPVATVPDRVTVPVKPPQVQNADNAEDSKRFECVVLVRTGQRALENKSYDEAMRSAQEARAAFANCTGAIELLQSARQAKDIARQAVIIQ